MATRSAIFGVRRYGSSTRGSGGRKRGSRARWPVLAKEVHLRDRLAPALGRAERTAHERVDRPGQDQIERDALEERVEQDDAGRCRLAEHEVEREGAERVEEGDDAHGEERSMRAVAARRLPVAADPVPGEREQQRADPERAEVRG